MLLREKSMTSLVRAYAGEPDAAQTCKIFSLPRSREHKHLVDGFNGYDEFQKALAIGSEIRRSVCYG